MLTICCKFALGAHEQMNSAEPAIPVDGMDARTRIQASLWLLVAAAPVIFSLITWPGMAAGWQNGVRHFSLPILAIEMAIVAFAMLKGFEPSATIAGLSRWVKVVLAALLMIAIGTAVLVAPDRQGAILRTSSSVLHLLFALALVFLFAAHWRQVRRTVWQSVVWGTLGYCALVAVMVALVAAPERFDWVHFQLGVTHVRQIGFYSVIGACSALGLAVISQQRGHYFGWVAAASVLLALSFWSGTRSSIVALIAAYFIALWFFPILRTIRAVGALVISLVAGLMLSFLHQVPHSAFGMFRMYNSSTGQDSDSGRREIWIDTWRTALEHPLFGYGESQFRGLVDAGGGLYNHPHNWPLQILFQWGAIGFACYFALAALIWFKFQSTAQKIGPAALPAYLTATALIVYSFYEGTLYHPYPIMMLGVAVAWVLSQRQHISQ